MGPARRCRCAATRRSRVSTSLSVRARSIVPLGASSEESVRPRTTSSVHQRCSVLRVRRGSLCAAVRSCCGAADASRDHSGTNAARNTRLDACSRVLFCSRRRHRASPSRGRHRRVANVNVISGTGADGDWTLQRQNEPTIACSSRNPQNCLAGANDYRTVDIPFPTIGEKITGDAWLGWYTTKDGGLTWRTRLLPGFPQDTSAAGLASPLKGYPAGADPDHPLGHERPLLLRRARLQPRGRRRQRDLRRAVHRQQQPGRHRRRTHRLPRRVDRAPHRPGADRRAPPGRGSERVPGRAQRRARRERRATGTREPNAARRRSAPAPNSSPTEQTGRQAVDGRRHPARRRADVHDRRPRHRHPAPDVPRRPRLHGLRAVRRARRRARPDHVQLLGRLRRTWSPPRVISRVPERATSTTTASPTTPTCRGCRRATTARCGQTGLQSPTPTSNNDCKVDLLDLNFVEPRRRPARARRSRGCRRARRSPSIP